MRCCACGRRLRNGNAPAEVLTGSGPNGSLATLPVSRLQDVTSGLLRVSAHGKTIAVPFCRRWPMDVLVALAISIGILIALWTYVALGLAALPVWAGIVAWGCFFAAGGKTTGLTKTIAANLSGVVWAFLALEASRRLGGYLPVLSVLVGVAALFMVLQAKIPALSFIPGAFLGAATAVSVVVGAGAAFPHPCSKTVIALVAGAVLGYLSEMLAGAMTRRPRGAAA